MDDTVLTKAFEAAPPVDRREILRYAGMQERDDAIDALIEECLAEILPRLSYRVVYCELPIKRTQDGLDLVFGRTNATTVVKKLESCERIVLFAATVGLEIDRMIARCSAASPTKAFLMQAIGTERIEALCDRFCEELAREAAEKGYETGSRFSPGYGDFSIETQREIFAFLDCSRRIGLTRNESMLMSPSKSVTAIVGLRRTQG